jgi:hypothetical protein
MPADPSCDSFLTAVFGVTLADITLVSYEFDYYACGRAFHWRDANHTTLSRSRAAPSAAARNRRRSFRSVPARVSPGRSYTCRNDEGLLAISLERGTHNEGR